MKYEKGLTHPRGTPEIVHVVVEKEAEQDLEVACRGMDKQKIWSLKYGSWKQPNPTAL